MQHKIACATNGYAGYDFSRVLQGVAAAGFEYVELTAMASSHSRIKPETMGEKEIEQLQSQLEAYKLKAASVSGHTDLTRQEGVELFKARIAFTACMGLDIINTGAGHTESPEAEAQFFANMRNEIIPFAAGLGVKIALESHGGLTGSADDCLQTLARLDSEWVGINYDPANVIYYRGIRPEEDLKKIARHVIHFHMKDQQGGQGVLTFPPLGEGTIDFKNLLDTLSQVDYQGPFSVEIEIKNLAETEEDQVRVHSRRYIDELRLR